jgi:hypothetical protein
MCLKRPEFLCTSDRNLGLNVGKKSETRRGEMREEKGKIRSNFKFPV